LLQYEREAWEAGNARVAGVDEAGRGPLAGPVVAAAVVFTRDLIVSEQYGLFVGLTDSKQLTERQREEFFALIVGRNGLEIGTGVCDAATIDKINILQATHRAMHTALHNLHPLPDMALIDGLPVPGLPCPSRAIVGGDARSFSIAAASVVAKVMRDRIMLEYDRQYPQYGFARHKGYGTKVHMQALLEYGPSPIHRRSFRPVRDAIRIRNWIDANPDRER
jgi:ribonuclease HII